MNDRHKFRRAIKCEKCGSISFRHGTLGDVFRFIETGTEQCSRCLSFRTTIIGGFEQCPGLKDRNGKLIFDGDKLSVLYPETSVELTGIVIWHNYKWVVEFDDCSRLSFDDMVVEQWDIKITGTIHDKEK